MLGLLSDLPRKRVEPIALAAGATVRTSALSRLQIRIDWPVGNRPPSFNPAISSVSGKRGLAVPVGGVAGYCFCIYRA
jgi:hypothetical protein